MEEEDQEGAKNATVAGSRLLLYTLGLRENGGNRERQDESHRYCDNKHVVILQSRFHQAGMIIPMMR